MFLHILAAGSPEAEGAKPEEEAPDSTESVEKAQEETPQDVSSKLLQKYYTKHAEEAKPPEEIGPPEIPEEQTPPEEQTKAMEEAKPLEEEAQPPQEAKVVDGEAQPQEEAKPAEEEAKPQKEETKSPEVAQKVEAEDKAPATEQVDEGVKPPEVSTQESAVPKQDADPAGQQEIKEIKEERKEELPPSEAEPGPPTETPQPSETPNETKEVLTEAPPATETQTEACSAEVKEQEDADTRWQILYLCYFHVSLLRDCESEKDDKVCHNFHGESSEVSYRKKSTRERGRTKCILLSRSRVFEVLVVHSTFSHMHKISQNIVQKRMVSVEKVAGQYNNNTNALSAIPFCICGSQNQNVKTPVLRRKKRRTMRPTQRMRFTLR